MAYEELSMTHPVSRRHRVCIWCGQLIISRVPHVRRVYKYGGDFNCDRMHIECFDAARKQWQDTADDGEFFPHSYTRGTQEDRLTQ